MIKLKNIIKSIILENENLPISKMEEMRIFQYIKNKYVPELVKAMNDEYKKRVKNVDDRLLFDIKDVLFNLKKTMVYNSKYSNTIVYHYSKRYPDKKGKIKFSKIITFEIVKSFLPTETSPTVTLNARSYIYYPDPVNGKYAYSISLEKYYIKPGDPVYWKPSYF